MSDFLSILWHFPRDFHARIGNNPPAPKTRVKNAPLLHRDAIRQSPVATRVNGEYRDKQDDCSNFFELTFCNAQTRTAMKVLSGLGARDSRFSFSLSLSLSLSSFRITSPSLLGRATGHRK